MNILFTGVGRRIELLQAFRNASLILNKELKLYGTDLDGTAPALAYCDYTRQVVGMKEPSYIEKLLNICFTDHIDLLIPTIDTDLVVLSQNKKKFENIGTRVMISDPEMIQICHDKNNTSQFFINCGLHSPLPVDNWKNYNGRFPAFIKPKNGSSSINAFKIKNVEELKTFAGQIENYIVQPFIEGKEYTIDIFCDWSGKPISIVPRERLQVRAGEVLKTKITLDQTMINESKRLCEIFKPCGPMTVQLIRDKYDIDWYIEINPRFGGGVPLSMKAGSRSAEAILKLLDNENVEYITDIADGAVYSRFDQSVCVEEGNNVIKGIIFDLDDTLYPEKEYVKSGFKAVSRFLGGRFEEKLWNYFDEGKPAIDELLKELGRESEKADILKIYRLHKPDIHLYPGIKEILKELKKKNIKIGIITDGRSESQRKKLDALNIITLIDDIIITDELGGIQFRKPCDIAFRIIATKWKLPCQQIVYIGDNPNKDFQAPYQLGMKSVLLETNDGIYTNSKNINNIINKKNIEIFMREVFS